MPKGEVEVRWASVVISTDGHLLGEVDGFVVGADEHITHFVLERGHLWGRKEVTIPIGAVARVESDAVHVALSKDEVGALPAARRPTRLKPPSAVQVLIHGRTRLGEGTTSSGPRVSVADRRAHRGLLALCVLWIHGHLS